MLLETTLLFKTMLILSAQLFVVLGGAYILVTEGTAPQDRTLAENIEDDIESNDIKEE